jgi:hypothetical protein
VSGSTGRTPARSARLILSALLLLLASGPPVNAQSAIRKLTTIDALVEFPGFFHLQNVLVRGEFVELGAEFVLRANNRDLRLMNTEQVTKGPVEVRGQFFDVGKLERSDPRLGPYAERFKAADWPRAGTEFALKVTAVSAAAPAVTPSVRALTLEPWKFDGQTVTVLGNFRARNLFGDVPEAPGKSRYDFVLSAAEGAIWVTNMRPRGRGFDLDVERRLDSGRWLEVTGAVSIHRGLALVSATQMVLGTPPAVTESTAEPVAPAVPLQPLEVVFSAPTADETDVPRTTRVRVQFSRGLREATLTNQVRVSYVGDSTGAPIASKAVYDPAARSITITFSAPLEPYRTVKVELLDGIRGFDDGPFKPWSVTFSVAGQ